MNDRIKEVVRNKYNLIAKQSKEKNESSCCGSTGCCTDIETTMFNDDYTKLEGYNPDADLGLGCGIPTEHAGIRTGDTVLDLGSGAGNDAFVARSIVGESGKVIGLDFAEVMLAKAKNNAQKLGYSNVEFIRGDIEEMPLPDAVADVVISNCVLNLVPDKEKAFKQIFRVLKSTGHISVSDVVISGNLPEALVQDATMYAGCVSGAMLKEDYLKVINTAGFKNVQVKKEKEISLPDDLLLQYLTETELSQYKNDKVGIFSITVFAEK
jgi:arsenite methyltransferase